MPTLKVGVKNFVAVDKTKGSICSYIYVGTFMINMWG